ncbi:hypothetical protein [Hydrogenobaculum acidophilum]
MIKFVENFEVPGQLETPVLYMVFNRPDIVQKAFGQIRKAKPKKLYIAQDGPRPHVPDEKDKIFKVREYILSNIDWECEVKTLCRDENLGIDKGALNAIDWFFENEEQGIILEEDVYMSLSGFWFLEKMLNKFKNDKDVWFVLAYNTIDIPYDYVKTDYFWSWGYATWKDKWENLNFSNRNDFGNIKNTSHLYKYFENPRKAKLYECHMMFHDKHKEFYDSKISRELICNKAFSIIPKFSFSAHIGFENSNTIDNTVKEAIFIDDIQKYHIKVNNLKEVDLYSLDNYEDTQAIKTFEKVLDFFGKYNIFFALVSETTYKNIQNITSRYKNISIYGIGVLGKVLYYVYNDIMNDKVLCFLDDNPQCNELFGKPVLTPENMPEDIDLVIISPQSKTTYQNMKKKVPNKDVVWLRDLVF